MTTPFPFDAFLVFGFLSIMLLAGILLRAHVGLLQRFLFPASILGGLLGLVLINFDFLPLRTELVESFAYHFFNISFISVGLTPPVLHETATKNETITKEREIFKGSLWMALVQGVTFPMQAVLGSVIVLLFTFLGFKLFPTFGLLFPLAFNEGPGQALSIGKVWQGHGFADATTIGLTLATLGFFFAFLVGVPLANWAMRKHNYQNQNLPQFFVRGILPRGETGAEAGRLTTHSGNVESLALHVGLIGLVYILTYILLYGMVSLVPPEAGNILWGFFFLFGLIVAILVRSLLSHSPYRHLQDPALQRRITGLAVDYLIVATGTGIQAIIVWQYMAPIAAIALVGGLATIFMVIFLSKNLDSYRVERMVAIYGVVTGTVACGLILLRIVDPELQSPPAREIGFMNIFAVPIIGGLTFLVNIPLWWDWSLPATMGLFAGIMALALSLLLWQKLWR